MLIVRLSAKEDTNKRDVIPDELERVPVVLEELSGVARREDKRQTLIDTPKYSIQSSYELSPLTCYIL